MLTRLIRITLLLLLKSILSIEYSTEDSSECLELTTWTITNDNGKIKISNIRSPIDVYSAFFKTNFIDWPLKGYNDIKYRWIGYENWTFTSNPFSIGQYKEFSLYVSGLDLSPFISINNNLIRTTSSEFVSEDISVNPAILDKVHNVLQLQFISPVIMAKYQALNNKYQVPPDCWPDEFHGECHINFLRKTQASFGWDWGPAIPTTGIRGEIKFCATNTVSGRIKSVKVLTKTNNNCSLWSAEIQVKVFVLLGEVKQEICSKIKISSLNIKQTLCMAAKQTGDIQFKFLVNLNVTILKLWWPHDMGKQVLYHLKSSVFHLDKKIASTGHYVGFRFVALNQALLPNNTGRYFEFSINCRSFFIKGTNWVPRTYLTLNWDNKTHIEILLGSVKKANMNSIRLWGGGKPENEHFYAVADRLGLMIWHDMMFACALYPNDENFSSIVYKEVTEIVASLQRHPSILVWSGNNEIEVLIAQGWYHTTKMDKNNIDRYYYLFNKIIKTAVVSEDAYTPFILSSPSNGVESEKNQGVAKDPQNPYFGDVHFYVYSGDLWNETLYPITRMTTEFGFQSLPNVETWKLMTLSEDDFKIGGPLMDHLQHHPGGNQELIDAIKFYFGRLYPADTETVIDKYKWFSYLSQINQANILKVHINKLLSSQCILTSIGEGMTRGAMYWQLNDNWIAPTWSTLDYLGNWKLAHYYVKNSFAPERVNMAMIKNVVTITVILPKYHPYTTYEVIITCRDFTRDLVSSITGNKTISFNSKEFNCNVEMIFSMTSAELIQEFKCPNKNSCIFDVKLVRNQTILSLDYMFLANPVNMSVPIAASTDKIVVKVERNSIDPDKCDIIMKSRFVHFYVFLTSSVMGTFSDNGFHLLENEKIILFLPSVLNNDNLTNCSSIKFEVLSLNSIFTSFV